VNAKEKSTRETIVEAADMLFYQQGYEHTTFADIAEAVNISRGNFYHHFKTKDEILDAVIAIRVDKTKNLLSQWEVTGKDSRDRIRCFINIVMSNKNAIKKYGCPVGTLNNELIKLGHSSKSQATGIFTLFREWLKSQFISLGCGARSDSFAMHLLALSQGVATLANAYNDENFIKAEIVAMCDWVDSVIKTKQKSFH
jgi:AcrR family transcriptional regulator